MTGVGTARGGLTIFHVQKGGVDVEGDESQTVGEDFVGDDGGVAPYVDAFDAYRGYLCDEDASEGVGDGRVDPDEIKVDGAIRETLDADGQPLVVRV